MFMFCFLIFVLMTLQVRVDCSTNSLKSLALFGIKEQVRISHLSKVRDLHAARTDGTTHSHFRPKDTIGEMSYSIVSGSGFCCSSPTIS